MLGRLRHGSSTRWLQLPRRKAPKNQQLRPYVSPPAYLVPRWHFQLELLDCNKIASLHLLLFLC